MTEIKEGVQLKINKTIYTVVRVDGPYAIIRTLKGGQFCYGLSGIRTSQILPFTQEAQLKLTL